MEKKSSGDSDFFGSFLESVQRSEKEESVGADLPLRLLIILAEEGPVELPKLISLSSLTLEEFIERLARLREAGLVEMEGSAGNETIQLTEGGLQVTRAMFWKDDEDKGD
jgi:hypothetical protein